MPDHVHMCVSMPPKYLVASVTGFIKGKSASAIARQFQGTERHYPGAHFWVRGDGVSTVDYEEEKGRADIREQEGSDGEGRF